MTDIETDVKGGFSGTNLLCCNFTNFYPLIFVNKSIHLPI